MDVPSARRRDLGWLSRNLGVENSHHPQFKQAINIITALRAQQGRQHV